jgi:outer membrane protein
MVFNFGKSYSKISGTADLRNASEQDLIVTKQNLILNTYIAYFTYLQAVRIKEVSTESLRSAEEHLKQAQSFFDVGTKPQFDVLKARTDETNAKVNLINSENNIRISLLQLENVLNTKLEPNVVLNDNLGIKKDTIGIVSAFNLAWENRPDYISAKYKIDANHSFLTSSWTVNLPSINLSGGYNWKTYSLDQNF